MHSLFVHSQILRNWWTFSPLQLAMADNSSYIYIPSLSVMGQSTDHYRSRYLTDRQTNKIYCFHTMDRIVNTELGMSWKWKMARWMSYTAMCPHSTISLYCHSHLARNNVEIGNFGPRQAILSKRCSWLQLSLWLAQTSEIPHQKFEVILWLSWMASF